MIDVYKVEKQAEKLCSDARAKRDANLGSVDDTIPLTPAPSTNKTDATASSTAKSVAAAVFLTSTSDLPSPMVVGPIDSTAAFPVADLTSPSDSFTYDNYTAATASCRTYPMANAPSTDPPITAAGRSNASSTAINPPPTISNFATDKEEKILDFFRNE